MNASDLDSALSTLDLSATDASQLLGIAQRTLRRWREGEAIPAAAEAALRAWLTLHEWGIPWRPDTVSVVDDDKDQIRRMREHAIDVEQMLERVKARGGPKSPWRVDFARRIASFDRFRVTFYELANGGFSLSTYSRADGNPDAQRDAALIEDAAYSIARAYRHAGKQTEALRAVADYTRANARFYAREGARMHAPDERADHLAAIVAVAERIDSLAGAVGRASISYSHFDALMSQLHKLGFFPESDLVAAVAGAFHGVDSNT